MATTASDKIGIRNALMASSPIGCDIRSCLYVWNFVADVGGYLRKKQPRPNPGSTGGNPGCVQSVKTNFVVGASVYKCSI